MHKLLSILLLISYLFVQNSAAKSLNPVVYSALGDNIYNNADAIAQLQNLKEYQVYKDDIIRYIKDVKAAKVMGFSIEEGDKSLDKGKYLKILRKLSKLNDLYVQNVKSNFKYAIKNEDNTLFVNSVDSGLLNIKRYENEIKKYYKTHEDEIENYGDILGKLVSTYGPKRKKTKTSRGPTKKEIQDAKMRRIRSKDKQKQEAIQKELEEELLKKKENIRKVQKKELESTSK